MIGPFTIFSFPDLADPDVLHLEHPTGDLYLDSAVQLHRYRERFRQLQRVLAGVTQSSPGMDKQRAE
jgi:hypothetical protein